MGYLLGKSILSTFQTLKKMNLPENQSSPTPKSDGSSGYSWSNPWVAFLLPFVVYMIGTSLEPTPDKLGGADIGLAIPYHFYPWIYALKIGLTMVAIGWVLPAYRQFAPKISFLSILVGLAGVFVWVGLCKLDLESRLLGPLGLGSIVDLGTRSGYNPFEMLGNQPGGAWTFWAIRLFGLTLVVPFIEEAFLRGFLMRYFVDRDWWDVPFGKVNGAAIAAAVVVPVLLHPAEMVAAAVWFSMVTWLMVKTRNFWDCVVAHAVTNGLLGLWVWYSGQWYFL
jgi:CAAX protease family protein